MVLTVNTIDNTQLLQYVSALDFVADTETLTTGNGIRVFPKNNAHITIALSEKIREQGWEIVSLYAESGRLDEVFRSITLPSTAGVK